MSFGVKLKIMMTALALSVVIYLKFFVDFDDLIMDQAEDSPGDAGATAQSTPP